MFNRKMIKKKSYYLKKKPEFTDADVSINLNWRMLNDGRSYVNDTYMIYTVSFLFQVSLLYYMPEDCKTMKLEAA